MSYLKIVGIQIGIILALFTASGATYVVSEGEQAVVTRMGNPVREVRAPGVAFKIPIFESVSTIEGRLIPYDIPPYEAVTSDRRVVLFDLMCAMKIIDPTKFLVRMKTIELAKTRVDTVAYSSIRNELGRLSFDELIGASKETIEAKVTNEINATLKDFGMQVVLTKVMRTDLPQSNQEAMIAQMVAERNSKAAKFSAEGDAEKLRIESGADRDASIIRAEAFARAEKIRGEGDSEAARIYNEAYRGSEDFYQLYRGAEVARETVKDGTKVFLSTKEPHLKEFFQ